MKLKVYLEPFSEFMLTKSPLSFKIMRLFGRIPFVRRLGFDHNYLNALDELSFSELKTKYDSREIVDTINADGFCSGIAISSGFLSYLIDMSKNNSFIDRKTGEGNFKFDFDGLINPGKGYIYSLLNPHKMNEKLAQFALQEVKPIADAYLGADSVILNSQVWVTFPDESNDYSPDFGFHYDLDDYRFLKLFIYLTDVDEESGPHEIIKTSHKFNAFYRFFNRRLPDSLPKKYSANVQTMLAKKGEGFFEDTMCYHKGTRPIKPRAIFQLQFALSDKSTEQ